MSLGAALLASSCMHGKAADEPRDRPKYREHESVQGAPPAAPAAPTRAQPENLLHAMAEDLGQRLGVKTTFQVLSVQPVLWDDSSLGCPQPERAYLPAQVQGTRVVFQYEGKTYQYHGSERGDFVYCENPAVSGLDEK